MISNNYFYLIIIIHLHTVIWHLVTNDKNMNNGNEEVLHTPQSLRTRTTS